MINPKIIIADFSPFPVITSEALVIACPIMIHNYGLSYYLEGFKQIQRKHPDLKLQFAIPCHDNVGLALKALDAGIKIIYFNQESPAWQQLESMARTYGAQLLDTRDLDD